MSVSRAYGKNKHSIAQGEVRSIKDQMRRKFGGEYESLIDREILAATNALTVERSGLSPRQQDDLRLSAEKIEDGISRRIQKSARKLNYQFQT